MSSETARNRLAPLPSALFTALSALGLFLVPCQRAVAGDSCKLGAEALQRRELAIAETLLKQCVSANRGRIDPYLDLCAVYQLQGKTSNLHQVALEGLKRFPEEKRFYLTVGTQAGKEERYEGAIEVFSEGFRRWPDDPRLRKSLASAHLLLGMRMLDHGRNEEAEPHLRRATQLVDDDIEAHLNLGRALHNLNQSVEALAEFDRVLALNGRTPLARFHRGMVLYTTGEYDKAIADLSQEIKINPDYPPSYLFRGLSLMAKGDWANALSDLDIAVLKMPENAKALYARARCLNQMGRTKEAEVDFRKTLEIDPSNPDVFNALGRLLWLADRRAEAEVMFQKARDLNKKLRTASPGEIRFEPLPSQKAQ